MGKTKEYVLALHKSGNGYKKKYILTTKNTIEYN